MAFDVKFDRTIQEQNVARLADTCGSLLSTSHRRHFVKSLMDILIEQRVEGERPYETDGLPGVVRGVSEQLGRSEGGEY
jgi:hypothetical protein